MNSDEYQQIKKDFRRCSRISEIKASENVKINLLEKKVKETNHRMLQIISIIQQIPSLSHIKPEALIQKEIE